MKANATKKATAKKFKPAGVNKGKLYHSKLAELELPKEPVMPKVAQARQFQLAHLAATLAKGDSDRKACELANQALLVWNAAGKALTVEAQARVLVKGLFWYDQHDWHEHGRALIGSQNDLEGGVPGQNAADDIRASYLEAQRKAGCAVNDVWKCVDWKWVPLKCLFPNGKISEAERREQVVRLVEYARTIVEKADALPWSVKDADPLKAAIVHAWQPLGLWDDAVFDKAVKQAREFVAKPGGEQMDQALAYYPFVARWLAVMRQQMAADAKIRC